MKNKTPRVIMFLASLPPMQMGGAEVQALRLCKQLLQQGVDVKIVTWGKLWHPRRGEYNGIPFTRVKSIVNAVADLPSLFSKGNKPAGTRIVYDDKKEVTNTMNTQVWRGMILRYSLVYYNLFTWLYFRRSQFDILHVHMMEWPAFTAARICRKLGKKLVVKDSTMNGISNLLRYPDGEAKQKEVINCANFVAMTSMIRENLLKAGVAADKITLIPNGITITPAGSRPEWSNKVIFVGNLTQQPAKGIDILLAAWQQVIQKIPSATLQVAGDGDIPAYEKFVAGLKIEKSVRFLGKQKNTKQLLEQADLFVLPSRREGMSNALMEAMACAMPVVVTDVSGSQDLVEHGVSGMIVPPADIDRLASAIIHMLSDPQRSIGMGRNAYEKIAAYCDIRKVGSAYENLYRQILGNAL